jgi:hypothetical protein
VVPLRYDHQNSAAAFAAEFWWRRLRAAITGSGGSANRHGDWGQSPLPQFLKEHDSDPQSAVRNLPIL